MNKTFILSLIFAVFSQIGFSQESTKKEAFQNITENVISGPLEFLSSDWTKGRDLGTEGAYMSADYVASMFKTFGLKPGGDYARNQSSRRRSSANRQPQKPQRSYFQNFNLLEYRSADKQSCSIVSISDGAVNEIKLNQNSDFVVTAGTRAVTIQSDVVFVGYGFSGEGYNDYKGIDVKNKVIIRLYGFPGHRNKESESYKKFAGDSPSASYYINRSKDQAAEEAGAVAVIEMSTFGAGYKGTPGNVPFRYNEKKYEGNEPFRTTPRVRLTTPRGSVGITKLILSNNAIEMLLDGAQLDIDEFENQAEKELITASKVLKTKKLKIETNVDSRVVQARNVVGIIEGKNKEACIVLGAHYDHLGQTRNYIYNGADDNASGTVGIMTIAKAIIETGIVPEYTLVFCAWTGEEKGLIGSRYFANNPLIEDMKCYMNYDMISRIALDDPDKNKCDFQFTSTVPLLKELTENHIKDFNVNLDIKYNGSEVPRGGSDFSSFSAIGVPIFLFHGKFTPDYHQYTDHADKADLTYMRDIIRMGFLNIYELSTRAW